MKSEDDGNIENEYYEGINGDNDNGPNGNDNDEDCDDDDNGFDSDNINDRTGE